MIRARTVCRFVFFVAFVFAPVFSGCGGARNPFTREDLKIEEVAVAPFFVLDEKFQSHDEVLSAMTYTDAEGDSEWVSLEAGREFQRGILDIPGFIRVLPPEEVMESLTMNKNLSLLNPPDLKAIGRNLGVDAVFIGAITHYTTVAGDPELGIWVSLYHIEDLSPRNTNWFLESAYGRGAIPMDTYKGSKPIFNYHETLDASSARTRSLLEQYSKGFKQTDRAFTPIEVILKQPWPNYYRFTFWDAVNNMIVSEEARQDAVPLE
ncbi:MAG: hypothetical protein NUW37_16830 [Planctomycetes bacterium]|nr:hypothetical protein [Planctomycetota bacterium]